MYKAIRFMDDLIDRVLTLIFVIVLLIGIYFIYDTAYVFYHASAARVSYFRPGTQAAEQLDRPFTRDYVGWITVFDTNIDYPVMQANNNSKYLNLDPFGDYSLAGSIFLDSRNAGDFSDSYSLLYGHHMSSGIMFGALDRYYEEEYFESHRAGALYLGDREYSAEAFAVLQTDAGVSPIFDPNGSETVLEIAKRDSLIYRDPSSTHILALSTCKEPGSTARTVVLMSLIEVSGEGVMQ